MTKLDKYKSGIKLTESATERRIVEAYKTANIEDIAAATEILEQLEQYNIMDNPLFMCATAYNLGKLTAKEQLQ